MLTDFLPANGNFGFDAVLNPQLAFPFCVSVPADGVPHEVLPAPPAGYVWSINQGVFSNLNVAASTYTLNQFTPAGVAQIVDNRIVPAGPTYTGVSILGALATASRLELQVSAGPVVFSGVAFPIPASVLKLFYFSLTAAEQFFDLSGVPEGVMLRPNTTLFGATAPLAWQRNEGASRALQFRLVRGGVTSYYLSGGIATGRTNSNISAPGFLRGDTAAISLSAPAPTGPMYAGFACLATPLQGRPS